MTVSTNAPGLQFYRCDAGVRQKLVPGASVIGTHAAVRFLCILTVLCRTTDRQGAVSGNLRGRSVCITSSSFAA